MKPHTFNFSIKFSLLDASDILTSDNSKPNVLIFNGPRTNEPNEGVVLTSLKMAKIASSMKAGDLLLVCITGGGSALLTLPVPLEKDKSPVDESTKRLSLEAIIKTTKVLSLDGASIQEVSINCILIYKYLVSWA